MLEGIDFNDVDLLPESITNELHKTVTFIRDKSAMFYRAFSRRKTSESVKKKFEKRNSEDKPYNEDKKMQDLFGVRIALYFKDDIEACTKLIHKKFKVDSISEDEITADSFRPVRLNIVCKLPQSIKEQIDEAFWRTHFIDDTFEIQIRTVFSEGWHEIEHDLRYKCQDDWKNHLDMSRALNGIFATLETCDWSIISIFDQFAYQKYQVSEWESMLRNKLRLRIAPGNLDEQIIQVFKNQKQFAKDILKLNRIELILALSEEKLNQVPRSFDYLIFIANEMFIHNSAIKDITPTIIHDFCEQIEN